MEKGKGEEEHIRDGMKERNVFIANLQDEQ